METAEQQVYERLWRARAFIDHCYDHPLNLDQISSQACFSRYHFLRLFRQAFNKTPHQYLIARRLEKAKELLSADDLRVTDVCFEVGFQSQTIIEKGVLGAGAFHTDDCRATYEELKSKGVEFVSEPAERPYGIEAVFKDNSGNWFSLTAPNEEHS